MLWKSCPNVCKGLALLRKWRARILRPAHLLQNIFYTHILQVDLILTLRSFKIKSLMKLPLHQNGSSGAPRNLSEVHG